MFLRVTNPLYIAIIHAFRHAEEPTHNADGIFVLMTIYCFILELWFHLLPVRRRKSAAAPLPFQAVLFVCPISSSAVMGRFRGRPFASGGLPSLAFCSFQLCRFINTFICSRVNPKCSAISRFVFPSYFVWNTSRSNPFIFVYFLAISKPSYGFYYTHRRAFLSLSVFTGRFIRNGGVMLFAENGGLTCGQKTLHLFVRRECS